MHAVKRSASAAKLTDRIESRQQGVVIRSHSHSAGDAAAAAAAAAAGSAVCSHLLPPAPHCCYWWFDLFVVRCQVSWWSWVYWVYALVYNSYARNFFSHLFYLDHSNFAESLAASPSVS